MTRVLLVLAAVSALSSYAENHIVPVPIVKTVSVERVELWVSHYSCSESENTANCVEYYTGNRPTTGTAASRTLPGGTRIRIRGQEYTILDYCGGCQYDGLDVYVESTEEALQLGAGYEIVEVISD